MVAAQTLCECLQGLLQEGWRVYELSRGHNRLDLDVKGTAYLSTYERTATKNK
jgi:hypothetical protein